MNKRPLHMTIDGAPCTLAQLDPEAALEHFMEYIQCLSCLDPNVPIDRSWAALSMQSNGEPYRLAVDQDELKRRLRPAIEWMVGQANATTNAYLVDGETY